MSTNGFIKMGAAAIFFLLLAGCAHGGTTALKRTVSLPDPYAARVEVVYRDITLQGKFERSSSGEALFSLDQPPSLAGIELALRDGELSARYGELAFSVDADAVPEESVLGLLQDALSALVGEEAPPAGQPLSLQNDHGRIQALLDENFLPQRITMENPAFSVRFTTE